MGYVINMDKILWLMIIIMDIIIINRYNVLDYYIRLVINNNGYIINIFINISLNYYIKLKLINNYN